MKAKNIFSISVFSVALIMSVVSVGMFVQSTKSSASVIKKSSTAESEKALPSVKYNGEEMYVAEASFYDYYSDSEINSSATPNPISDAKSNLNTYSQFNKKLLELMKYGDTAQCPAKYPLYQGHQGYKLAASDFAGIYWPNSEEDNAKSNYWLGANNCQVGNNATQGLVDSKLTVGSDGETYITQSNPDNGKSACLPYFDKKFLTTNKYNNSQMTLGEVKENVAFPFRRVNKNGVEYFEFDSTIDTVRFNSNNQLDYLGANNKKEQVLDVTNVPGFFPYNVASDSNSNKLNFAYGAKIEVPFLTTKDGKVDGKDMVFEFTGDDDVWVFIDGILALDLGGAHPKISGSINFAEGVATVSSVKNNKVALAKRNMGLSNEGNFTDQSLGLVNEPTVYKNLKTPFSEELKKKLSNTRETHTLTLFYMERGKQVANMKMNFNLIEPTKYTVSNEVTTDDVSESFKNETEKVVNKDEFVYDVVDKTTPRASSIELKNKESVIYYNEFENKDNLLTQQRALKSENRKMTELYTTKWALKDQTKEIAAKTGLIVSDSRLSQNGLILFSNSDGKGVPVLTTSYANAVRTNTLTIGCSVTDKIKTSVTDYKNLEFKYLIQHSNVFGGDSAEAVYIGKYKVYKEDGTSEERSTNDGIISLKDGEKAVVEGIPVLTTMKVTTQLEEKYNVGGLRATSQFKYDGDKGVAQGTINNNANIVEFTIGDKDVNVKVEEIKDETSKKDDTTKEEETKVNEVGNKLDAEIDESPKTGDETNVKTWLILMGISLSLTAISGVTIINQGKRKED